MHSVLSFITIDYVVGKESYGGIGGTTGGPCIRLPKYCCNRRQSRQKFAVLELSNAAQTEDLRASWNSFLELFVKILIQKQITKLVIADVVTRMYSNSILDCDCLLLATSVEIEAVEVQDRCKDLLPPGRYC